jgi:hypothetical protein
VISRSTDLQFVGYFFSKRHLEAVLKSGWF